MRTFVFEVTQRVTYVVEVEADSETDARDVIERGAWTGDSGEVVDQHTYLLHATAASDRAPTERTAP